MVEYGLRVLFAGLIIFIAGLTGTPDMDFAWKWSLAYAAIAAFGYQVENKNLMNKGIAGFYGVAEAAMIALLTASTGRLEQVGFAALAPIAWAITRKGADAMSMAPLGGGVILAAWSFFAKTGVPSAAIFTQIGLTIFIGTLLESNRVAAPTRSEEPTIDETLLLMAREEFRKLEDQHRDLVKQSRPAILLKDLDEARQGLSEGFFDRLAQQLLRATKVQSVGVYALAQFEDTMVVRGTAGHYGDKLSDTSIAVDLKRATGQVKHFTDKALLALRNADDKRTFLSILLNERGKVVGMINLADDNGIKLGPLEAELESIAGSLAQWFTEHQRRESLRRRARQAETLYELASLTSGATTTKALADRVVTDLWETLDVDHVAIWKIDGDQGSPISTQGVACHLLEDMSFSEGSGLPGWLATGAPELAMFDVRNDSRCPAGEALRQRIGSFCVQTILVDGRVFGYLTTATNRMGGIDVADIETLRLVAAELGRTISRIESTSGGGDGAMTPSEFQAFVRGQEAGILISLEPIRKAQLEETYGRPALMSAYRQYVTRIRAKLPSGGAICRKADGGFVVYLPGGNEEFGRSWANDAAATASMIGLKTPDGLSRIPLAMRAKVALMGVELPVANLKETA